MNIPGTQQITPDDFFKVYGLLEESKLIRSLKYHDINSKLGLVQFYEDFLSIDQINAMWENSLQAGDERNIKWLKLELINKNLKQDRDGKWIK